jgi:uncharacterized delta-60 repeat protein
MTFGNRGDRTVGPGGGPEFGQAVAALPDGGVLAAVGHDSGAYLARYRGDGTPDASFADGGRLDLAPSGLVDVIGLALDRRGGALVAGEGPDRGLLLARYDLDGKPDRAFGAGGTVAVDLGEGAHLGGLTVDHQGRILLAACCRGPAGKEHELVLTRLSAEGAVDPTFGTGGVARARFAPALEDCLGVMVAPAGEVLVLATDNTGSVPALVRLKEDGSLDSSFGRLGRALLIPCELSTVTGLIADGPGHVLVSGPILTGPAANRLAVARFALDGTLDMAFADNGLATYDPGVGASAWGLARDAEGRILLIGTTFGQPDQDAAVVLGRLTAAGAPDPTFAPGGAPGND